MKRLPLIALALCLLVAAPVLAGEDPEPYYAAGVRAEAARDFKTALENYDKVLDLDEEYKDAFDRWDACQKLAEWQSALKGEPTAMDLVRLGEVYLELHRYMDEKACYEEALAKDENCQEAHGHLALWHYVSGKSEEGFAAVYRETLRYLELSPYRKDLEESIADFKIYGALRNRQALLGEDARKAYDLSRKKKYAEAAALYQREADREGEAPGARIYALSLGAVACYKAGDVDGARKMFQEILAMPGCQVTQQALLYLAMIETKAGNLERAVEHLRDAVREGSGACREIDRRRKSAFKALFTAEDEQIRRAVEELTDPKRADEPLRRAIAAAKEKAAKEGKKVLIHWYGPYCPFVMAMQERLVHPEVKALIAKHYVYVRVDQGQMHRAVSLDHEFGDVMQEHGVPCFFVLDPKESVPTVQKDIGLMGAEQRSYSVEKIVEFLEDAAK